MQNGAAGRRVKMDRRGQQGEEYLDASPGDPQSNHYSRARTTQLLRVESPQLGDYYMEGQQVMGEWMGQGAESLGLTGATHTDEFVSLCRNLHPATGERLTQRHNGKRVTVDGDGKVHELANRRVFFDFTLSPPKSVSIAALIGDDQRIVDAHDGAVRTAFQQLERYAATRVRKAGETSYRMTGNLVGAVFRHDTSRALAASRSEH